MTKRYKMCQRHIKFVKEEVKKELGTVLTAGLREEKLLITFIEEDIAKRVLPSSTLRG